MSSSRRYIDIIDISPIDMVHISKAFDDETGQPYSNIYRIDGDDLFHKIVNAIDRIHGDFHARVNKLYIGPEDLQELTSLPIVKSHITFKVTSPSSAMQLMDIEVHVIPWMRGMLLLP